SGLHPELFEIQLPLDLTQRGVVDLAPIAQLGDRGSLGIDDAALDLLVLDSLLAPLGCLLRILGREVLGSISQPRLEPVEQRKMARPAVSQARDLVQP